MYRALAIVLLAASALSDSAPSYRAPAPAPALNYGAPACHDGLVRRADGSCAQPIITRNLYLYNAPAQTVTYGPPPILPDPKVHFNYVFVRTPAVQPGPRPVVVPPPQQKTLVYLLSQRPGAVGQEVIEVPSTPTQPEVYFVNYNDGDNPQLPGGIDLQTALSQSAAQGQVIGGDGGFGGGFGHGSDESRENGRRGGYQ
ncbi:uncharacterized protein LOC108682786 [Hyalella azteca]|uniref:Uncharacterized protein LOC108682786 n=1 Tax=Hyalella azteca TaxID=294128 RepID=A0A8B7PNF1_HYAAZ|nr:uncharacterized protein LOC108682786 [Hyalella azteca]